MNVVIAQHYQFQFILVMKKFAHQPQLICKIMTTKVTFRAISQGRIIHKTIPIQHPDFELLPSEIFNGYKLPEQSIDSQVIDYLDSIDKSDIMAKYDFDIILDYYIKRKTRKRNEIQDFIEFMKPYVNPYPELQVPLERIMSEAKDVLFGHHKSNETKAKELFKMAKISMLSMEGIVNHFEKFLKEDSNIIKSIKAIYYNENSN